MSPALSQQRPTPWGWAPLICVRERSQEGSCSCPCRTFCTSAGDPKVCTQLPARTHSASRFAAREPRSKARWRVEHRHNTMAAGVSGRVTKSLCPESLAFRRLPGLLCCSPTLVAIVSVALPAKLCRLAVPWWVSVKSCSGSSLAEKLAENWLACFPSKMVLIQGTVRLLSITKPPRQSASLTDFLLKTRWNYHCPAGHNLRPRQEWAQSRLLFGNWSRLCRRPWWKLRQDQQAGNATKRKCLLGTSLSTVRTSKSVTLPWKHRVSQQREAADWHILHPSSVALTDWGQQKRRAKWGQLFPHIGFAT